MNKWRDIIIDINSMLVIVRFIIFLLTIWGCTIFIFILQTALSRSRRSKDVSYLFEKHPLIPKNKAIVPEICVALLSCRRVYHLRKTLRAIILYFAKVEPTIIYEIAVLDNNSDYEEIQGIFADYPIDIVILR